MERSALVDHTFPGGEKRSSMPLTLGATTAADVPAPEAVSSGTRGTAACSPRRVLKKSDVAKFSVTVPVGEVVICICICICIWQTNFVRSHAVTEA